MLWLFGVGFIKSWFGVFIHYFIHATGEAFIGQEKCSVIMESGLGLRKVYFITLYQNKN